MKRHLIPAYMMVVVGDVKSDGCLRDACLSPLTVSGAQKMIAISLMACTPVVPLNPGHHHSSVIVTTALSHHFVTEALKTTDMHGCGPSTYQCNRMFCLPACCLLVMSKTCKFRLLSTYSPRGGQHEVIHPLISSLDVISNMPSQWHSQHSR